MEEDVKSLTDYLNIIVRRKFMIVIPALVMMIASVVVAVALPPVYESQATILIEQQQIPTDLVKSTVTSYADERINLIQQRVMTIDNLTKIINKFGLYTKEKEKLTAAELAEQFRASAHLELVNADVISQGRHSKATLAFKLLFDDKDPGMAQKVTNELVTLFLNENVKTRTQRAEETTVFLEEESEKFKIEIQRIENQLAEYKEKYSNSLPEMLPVNLSLISRVENQIQQLSIQEKMLDERKISLHSQLAMTSPQFSDGSSAAEHEPTSMAELKLEETRLLSKYTSTHPDVLRIKRLIENVNNEKSAGNHGESQDLQAAREDLAKLRQQYSDSHPDVKAAQRKLAELESAEKPASTTPHPANDNITNPTFLQIKGELDVAELELANIKQQRNELQEKLKILEVNVSQTHQVERGYYDLMRDLENQREKYKDLKNKQLEAKLAQTLEEEQMAEKFSLLEPPVLPNKPIKPNRFKILMLGFIVSIGGGIGLGFLAEMIDGGIRGHRALASIVGVEPLIVIPYIKNQEDKRRSQKTRITLSAVGVLFLFGMIVAIHIFYMPLDMLWIKIWNRLGVM